MFFDEVQFFKTHTKAYKIWHKQSAHV